MSYLLTNLMIQQRASLRLTMNTFEVDLTEAFLINQLSLNHANPTPSKTTHNTFIEIVWTLIPVLILVAIAIPSISLLAAQYKPAGKDAVTIKVIGHQWYWSYQYPDHGDFEIVSNMLTDAEASKRGEPRLLAVDNRLIVPVGTEIKAIVTSEDVIHAFAVPAFWTKMDAVPGRLNEVTFKVEKEGVYYGQCSELCGARHAFMPIAVEVVSKENFARWVASKGGKMPGAEPVAAPASAATPAAWHIVELCLMGSKHSIFHIFAKAIVF